ncbi:uncharacterized protein LOC121924369 [Sceloporus undulatus]|uniref:uncharacterized protein LOC121924369 n=1 Tax=Sceloporus undulatus TaxID=8520 RepID=UPI001C4CCCD9|nr:uncharacterized protein LOC121924369 [Sceloporus undulatus]
MKLSATPLLLGATVAVVLSSSLEREYILIPEPQTFSNAYCHCRQHGTTLATFRDETDLELAASLCFNCSVWIGLYRQFLSWVWINSDPYKFQKWSPGTKSSYNCAVMKNGLWYQENCLQKNPFVCYKGPTGALPLLLILTLGCSSKPGQMTLSTPSPKSPRTRYVTAAPGGNGLHSPLTVQDLPSASSSPEQETSQKDLPTFPPTALTRVPPTRDQIPTVIQENSTWFEALAACKARGQILARRIVLQQGLKVWLGLHRHGLWGYWVWVDGSPVPEEPQSWGEGEPNDPIWGNCGAGVGTGDGVIWEDECCVTKLYYVCE